MGLPRQTVSVNFSNGIDTKPDPNQLQLGAFTALENSIFDKLGQMRKRNGFANISSPPLASSFITTFKENLQAIGSNIQSYSSSTNSWVNAGKIQPLQLSTLPVVRNNVNQTYCDSAIATNGLVCTAYTENNGSAITYKYVVANSVTGQNVIGPTTLAATTPYGMPKVFILANYFIIVYTKTLAGPNYSLSYVAVNTVNLSVRAEATLAANLGPSTTGSFDGVVINNQFFAAYNLAGAGGVSIVSLTSTFVNSTPVLIDAAHQATLMSVTSDSSSMLIWVSFFNSGSSTGFTYAIRTNLTTFIGPVAIATNQISNITSVAQNGLCTIFFEFLNNYSYDGSIPTHFIDMVTVTNSGTKSADVVVARSVGLGSKAFIVSGDIYVLGSYQSAYQSTYFLLSSTSTSASPVIAAELASGNGGGYLTTGLPNVTVIGTTASMPYLIKDLVEAVNKNTAVPAGTQVNGIYTQTGVNVASFNFTATGLATVEIGNNLHLNGGYLRSYDGFSIVEHDFFIYPENVEVSWSAAGGAMAAQPDGLTNTNAYFYQLLYRWTDQQGNVFRSSVSIPVPVTTTGAGSAGSVTINTPTLRLTAKVISNVVIEAYRWSVKNQTYYLTGQTSTPVVNPVLNSTTIDSVTFIDTNSDATILGNELLYTTGGVLEDTAAPSFNAITLFDTRLWGIEAEDPNKLWFSKPVVENTPVEMTPLQTIYVAPNISEKQNTGNMKCIFPMDDKIIIFKKSSLFYINGKGPDVTGQNSQYSEPTFITAPVGCSNPNSIILIPNGLMFQSLKGIWLLDRSLNASYIGAPVEKYNSATVLSVVAIPDSNRVVFSLDNGVCLAYDYFVNKWGTFNGISNISSVIYNDLHTYLSTPVTVVPPTGSSYTTVPQIFQETPGIYLDGANPVLMNWTTGWISMAGLQGYKRAYWMFLLAEYQSPHTFSLGIAYDFNSSVVQQPVITPTNVSTAYGGDDSWGVDLDTTLITDETWGGSSAVEQWQIGFERQTCQSFQLSFSEMFDPSKGVTAGAGLTLSAMELVVGVKKAFPRNIPSTNKTG